MKFEIVNKQKKTEQNPIVKAELEIDGDILYLNLNGNCVVRITDRGEIDTNWSAVYGGRSNAGTIKKEVIYGV